MRLVAIAMMCGTMICFTGVDTSSKWLGAHVPTLEIVWARYVAAATISLMAARPWARPGVLRSRRPGLQSLRSLLLVGSTITVVFALHWLQLAEAATIGFLNPIFVALLAAPLLGERVGREQVAAIAVSFVGVLLAVRPGTSAFQPVVLIAIGGVILNSGYVIATRKLARLDFGEDNPRMDARRGGRSADPGPALDLAMAGLRRGLARNGGTWAVRDVRTRSPDRRPQICSRPISRAILLHSAHLDDRLRDRGVRRTAIGRDGDRRGACRRIRRVAGAKGAAREGGARSRGAAQLNGALNARMLRY